MARLVGGICARYANCMSQMVAVRIEDRLLAEVDGERKRRRISGARAIHEALQFWLHRELLEEAIRREHEAYTRRPVRQREFAPLIGAQVWPKWAYWFARVSSSA